MTRAVFGLGIVIALLLAAILAVMIEQRPYEPVCWRDGRAVISGECRID